MQRWINHVQVIEEITVEGDGRFKEDQSYLLPYVGGSNSIKMYSVLGIAIEKTALYLNYLNLFNPNTMIVYRLPD